MPTAHDLLDAAKKGDLAKVSQLLRPRCWGLAKGIGVDAEYEGYTALRAASQYGHRELVAFLIEKGADVHAQDTIGATALSYAAKGGHKEIAALLITKGAMLQPPGVLLAYPLDFAATNGHREMVALLLEQGADANAVNATTFTALHMAVLGSRKEVAELLLAHGADPNAKDKNGETPLAFAVRSNQNDLLALLIQKDGDIRVRNNAGYTLLELARAEGNSEIAASLEQHFSTLQNAVVRSREVATDPRSQLQRDAGQQNDDSTRQYEANIQRYRERKANGEFDQVIAELEPVWPRLSEASELRTILSNTFLDRGAAKYKMGRDAEALRDFEAATKVDQGNWKAFANLSCLHMADQRWPEALRTMERAFQINKALSENQGMLERLRQMRAHV
jgi:tetratricopeptide (TPR) repeat protein